MNAQGPGLGYGDVEMRYSLLPLEPQNPVRRQTYSEVTMAQRMWWQRLERVVCTEAFVDSQGSWSNCLQKGFTGRETVALRRRWKGLPLSEWTLPGAAFDMHPARKSSEHHQEGVCSIVQTTKLRNSTDRNQACLHPESQSLPSTGQENGESRVRSEQSHAVCVHRLAVSAEV